MRHVEAQSQGSACQPLKQTSGRQNLILLNTLKIMVLTWYILFIFALSLCTRGAGKSLVRPWKETSYSDQDLQHYTKNYGVQKNRNIFLYRGADKSLSRPRKETSYSDQDLQHYIKNYGVQKTGIYSYTGVLISPYPDPGKKQATAIKTYNTIPRIMAYKQQPYIPAVCTP